MKKIITFLMGIMASTLCFAQLQNGDFEAWNSTSINDPSNWLTSNLNSIKHGSIANVTQYTPAHGGNYAVKLTTIANSLDTVFGLITNSVNPMQAVGGTPYTAQPDSFICNVKTGLQIGDTALVLVVFKNGGSPIGMNIFKIYGNAPTAWQRLAFKLATLPMAPDTMIFAAVSSNAMSGPLIPGSFIVYDDISFGTSAPITNEGFENWNTTLNFDIPSDWSCGSSSDFTLNGYGIPIHKTTDKYYGQYALRMKTMEGDNNMHFCGINNGDWNSTLTQYMGGFPYTHQKDTLEGWYKYTPKVSGASATISIQFKKAGTYGLTSILLPAASTWTKFQIFFNLTQAPDSAIITINSSTTPFNVADTGSVLIIDALQLKSSPLTGINSFSVSTSVLIGPNPTNGEFSIFYIPKNTGKVSYILYDEVGKVVKSDMLRDITTTLNISGYPKGVYFIKINDGNSVLSKKLVLQ